MVRNVIAVMIALLMISSVVAAKDLDDPTKEEMEAKFKTEFLEEIMKLDDLEFQKEELLQRYVNNRLMIVKFEKDLNKYEALKKKKSKSTFDPALEQLPEFLYVSTLRQLNWRRRDNLFATKKYYLILKMAEISKTCERTATDIQDCQNRMNQITEMIDRIEFAYNLRNTIDSISDSIGHSIGLVSDQLNSVVRAIERE